MWAALCYSAIKFDLIIIKMELDNAKSNNLLDDHEKKPDDPRLDSLNAFFILFAVSFGPAFIAIDLSTDSSD